MTVSFSAKVKSEICRIGVSKKCCAIAQCFGILLYCNSFSAEGIRIVTESREFALILPKLFKKAFGLDFDSYPSLESAGKLIFQITDPVKISDIMEIYGFDTRDTLALHINLPVVEDDCCKAAFLRGAFLAGGSVTDPSKGYHIEFTTTHPNVARECFALLQEAMVLTPKLTKRGGGHVLYLKQSDRISDLLTYLGAPVAAMGIMEAKLEKELNNEVNRRCNCDEANTSKVVEAAQTQFAAIQKLRKNGFLDQLPKKLQDAANAREANPEATLTELAAMMEPPITKPAMNHRLQKLIQLAQEA